MKKKTLTSLLLALCLSAQLNLCSAEKNYDEEITLPIGTNFDLEMEEVTRYEYDGEYVKAITVNNKEQFILQKPGDTIITVIMDDKGVKTELRVLVHIVSEQQYNTPTAPNTTAPNNTAAKPGTPTTPNATTTPTTTTKPGATQATTTPSTVVKQPAAVTQPGSTTAPATKPATTASKLDTVIPPDISKKNDTEVKQSQQASHENTVQAQEQVASPVAPVAPVAPAKPAAVITEQTITRPSAQPQSKTEAVKYKAEQYAFDVLDLINAEREKYNLRPLSMAKDLQGEATLRARELPIRFSHTRPDGSKYYTVMNNTGITNGENIAAGQATPTDVVKAWMNSTVSRETILSPAYTELGVGYYETSTANYSSYWIQLFRG